MISMQFHADMQLYKGEFSEKFQMASDLPPLFSENHDAIFSKKALVKGPKYAT